ncbi:RNA-directed DNA polymerase from mobile element jockey [Eumeta japonica]|uniref:RNA-directed DNA polymerase from mobile element jockey n=1 Tax=Eumeta variegata TaxID=151549 RepID=A0A4C2A0W8_EUMVA|nr:RNA-directed DNA polymerase from mobile element jockey [Eumeta japonica]
MDFQRRRLGRDDWTDRRGLEVPPPAQPQPNRSSSSSVSIVRQNGDAPLRRQGSGGDSGRALRGAVHPTPSIRFTLHRAGTRWDSHHSHQAVPRRAMVAMTRLFNGILRAGHFPACWKTGRVIAIPKPGKDPRLASSERPITLLSHIAKLFERVLLRRLLRHLTPRQEQFGFRSGHSTTLQLARELHHMAVEHNRGAAPLGSFSTSRRRSTDRGRDLGPASHQSRVPQGSCLSPCLYAVYTDDIPTLTDQLQHWEEDVVLALYADDSAYLASSHRVDLAAAKLQRVLDLLPDWLDRWRVAVNVTKTAAFSDRPTACLASKAEIPGTGGGMAN